MKVIVPETHRKDFQEPAAHQKAGQLKIEGFHEKDRS
jgi:hypothetical protein